MFRSMDWFDISITRTDIERWLLEARDYTLPHLLQTLGQVLLGAALFIAARWIITRIERRFTSKTTSLIDDHIAEAVRRGLSISIVMWVAWRTSYIWGQPALAGVVEAVWIVALAIPTSDLVAKLLRVVEEQVVRRRLERYHSPAVVDRITASSEAEGEALVADERKVTVVFADVVCFTRRCEKMEPRAVAEMLNRYFSVMTEAVFRREGTLDKFIGDCLMAVFGAPLSTDDHAARASLAALDSASE